MTTTCTVRPLAREDAEAWASLRWEALEGHPLAFGSAPPDSLDLLVEQVRPRLETSEESAVFGAFADAALIGIVGVHRCEGRKERHKSFIWGMYVTAGHRGTGAGAMLLRAAIQQARTWPGVEQVHLSVSDVAQAARRLYERHGFEAWGCEPRALCWEGRYADETKMVLALRTDRPA